MRAECHDHERPEDDVEPAEIGDRFLDEGHVKTRAAGADDQPGRKARDQEFEYESGLT